MEKRPIVKVKPFEKADIVKINGGSFRNEFLILEVVANGYVMRNLYSNSKVTLVKDAVNSGFYKTGTMATMRTEKKYKGKKGR